MRISILHTDPNCQPEVDYVIDFLDRHPSKPADVSIVSNDHAADLTVQYGSGDKEQVAIPKQDLVFARDKIDISLLLSNVYRQAASEIFSVEKQTKDESPFIHKNRFGFDILETIFFHISRYEEYYCDPDLHDQWGMMHEDHHFLVRNDIYHRPIVDNLVFAFFTCLGLKVESVPTRFAMTHDIDVLRKFGNASGKVRSTIRATLDQGMTGLRKAANNITQVAQGESKDPYDTFDALFVKNDFDRKICFVMAGGETKHDNYYQIDGPEAKVMLDKAIDAGYEIGLHPSYNAGYKEYLFKSEKKKLEDVIQGGVLSSRQHFLRYDFKRTQNIIEGASINLDSTLGYQRLIGYRCGTGFAYHLFDFEKRKNYNHLELPMIIMDGGLLDEAKQDLTVAKSILEKFLQENQESTYITFNFHNTIFDPLKRDVDGMIDIYNLVNKL